MNLFLPLASFEDGASGGFAKGGKSRSEGERVLGYQNEVENAGLFLVGEIDLGPMG